MRKEREYSMNFGPSKIKLKIAEIIIELKSKFPVQPLESAYGWRCASFIYRGNKKPRISFNIELRENLPLVKRGNKIFIAIHPLSKDVNWILYQDNDKYIIEKYVPQKEQVAILNKDFKKGIIYLLSKDIDKRYELEAIIYDLLQIILINYLADKKGIFVHGIGLKDVDDSGFLFIGPTQSGKSTTARLWHKYSKAKVLNDDRVIIRKVKGKFFIFGTPWHGDFNDYLKSVPDKAELKNLFFIYHHSRHRLDYLKSAKAFKHLYPNIFPTFWNKEGLSKQTTLCQDLTKTKPCFYLGFKKNKSVISFVRQAKETTSL